MRRIGVLMNTTAEDPLGQAGSAAFAQGLQQLGWEVGFNIRVDYSLGCRPILSGIANTQLSRSRWRQMSSSLRPTRSEVIE
jgi:hypothetical protein